MLIYYSLHQTITNMEEIIKLLICLAKNGKVVDYND